MTLRSYPFERATVNFSGYLYVPQAATNATIDSLTLVDTAAGAVSLQLNGNGVKLLNNDITNNHTEICVDVGYYTTSNAVIEGNHIHGCGSVAHDNHDHGIYLEGAPNAVVRNNVIEDIWGGWTIQAWPYTTALIENNTLRANANQTEGGIIIAGGSQTTVTFRNNTVVGNGKSSLFDAYQLQSGAATATGNCIDPNGSPLYEGGWVNGGNTIVGDESECGTPPPSLCRDAFYCGDLETGDFSQYDQNQWGEGPYAGLPTSMVGHGDCAVVTSPVRQGSYAARCQVRPTTGESAADRAEMHAPDAASTGDTAQVQFYGWWTMFPGPSQDWWPNAGDFNDFFQFGQYPNGLSGATWPYCGVDAVSLPARLFCEGPGFPYLPSSGRNKVYLGAIQYDHWYHFVVEARWSHDPAVGYLSLWVDGVNVSPKTFGETLTGTATQVHVQYGVYRAAYTSTNTVIHDGLCRAVSFAAAASCDASTPSTPPPPPPSSGPSVTITEPVDGSTTTNSAVCGRVTATDDKGIAKVVWVLDGRSSTQRTYTVAPYNYTCWGITVGQHTIKATATDTDGNTASDTNTWTRR